MAHAEAYLHQYLGLAQLQQGRRREAELAFRRGLEHTSRNFGEGSPQYALTAVLLARTLYLTGAFDVADALLSGPLEMIIAGDSWFDVLAAGIISKCWILARTGHRDEAFVTAASGIRLAAMRGLPRLDRFCRLQVVRLNLYFGRVKEAVTEFLSLEGDPFDTTLPNRSFDLEMQLTRAALNLVEGSVPSQIIFEIESIEWDREPNPIRIEARLLLAAAYALANEQDAALQLLRESLDLIAREELRALVFQWGEVLAPLFAAAARDFDRFTLEQRKLLGNSIPQVGSTRGTSAACDEGPLTAREIHVVRGLADGLSSKEIARALGIAESTVKTHRLSIYRKLNVHSRSRVIVAARQLGLLRSTSAETGDPA
jgi:LuxR family maltose regulon positive regulatory protein